jgi:hypothetical protein
MRGNRRGVAMGDRGAANSTGALNLRQRQTFLQQRLGALFNVFERPPMLGSGAID